MLHKPRAQDAIAYAALALALIFMFVDQAHDTGFQKGHRGWCSANVLAIIERATAENGFVGYTNEFKWADGRTEYSYFDRYPVFFSVAMHGVLNAVQLTRGQQIYVARQAMNVLHALAVVMALAFLVQLGFTPALGVGAVALAASGTLLVTYRDMVHFDQAALAGFVTLLWAVARWYRGGSNRLIYLATAFAVCMGRGYASFAVLGLWWIVEAVRVARALKELKPTLRTIAHAPATRACLLSIGIAATCLSYNIWREAEKNDVHWTEVGIVDSALKRVTLNSRFDAAAHKKLEWSWYTVRQAQRIVSNVQPFVGPGVTFKSDYANVLLMVLVFGAIGAFIATRSRELRPPLIVAALSGAIWLIGMRGLTAFHEFTIMFMFPAIVLLMLALIIRVPERAAILPALLGCVVLVLSTASRNRELRAQEAVGEVYTKDFARIAKVIEPREPYATDPINRKQIVPGVPYALGWFLPDNPILRDSKGDLLLSTNRKKKGAGKNLTPENKKLFLYRK